LMKIIDKIVSRVGRRVDESSPMVDARLPDGSRVNAIIPPLAIDGPMMSIRRFATIPYTMEDILGFKTLTPEMAEILQGLVKAKIKIIDKIVSRVGRRVDESSPMVDARLPDGSRVNAIIPPLAIDGPMMSIRRFATIPYTMEDILGFKTLTPEMAEILQGLVKAKI